MSTGINIAPSSDLTVGATAVTSGTDTRVFFQAGGVVQQDANFTFDNTLKRLTLKAVGTAATDIPFVVRNSAGTQNIVSFNGDGRFLIGQNASNTCIGGVPQYAIAIGASAAVSGASETYGSPIAIGYDAQSVGTSALAIGNSTRPNTGIAIGHGVQSRAEGVAIGGSTTNSRGTVMGSGSSNSGYGGSSIGYDVDNTGDGSFLIGYFHSNSIASSFVWGSNGIKFWVNSNSNLVLANNKAITDANKATYVDTSATNTFTIHSGTAPVANITDAFQQYSADRGGVAGKASAHFRAEDGTINVIGDLSGFGTSAPGARLDVRSQGALSTDIAFRVRNSADTATFFTVRGDQAIEMIRENPSTNGGVLITRGDAYNSPNIKLYSVFNSLGEIDGASSTVRFNNLRSGTTSGNGYFGIVNPSSQDRFLKFVDLFGNEYISMGGSNYDGGGGVSFTLKTTTNTGANFITFSRNDNTNRFVISDQANVGIGGTTFGTSAKFVTAQFTGTAPTTSPVDAFQQYSADITAGNAAPHFRTENGAIIKVYQETTAVAASTLVGGGGTTLTDTDTFDGYTLKQIVKALRNQGLLA